MAIKKLETDALALLEQLTRAHTAAGFTLARFEVTDQPAAFTLASISTWIHNAGPATLWLGDEDSVQSLMGIPVPPGARVDLPFGNGVIFGAVSAEETATADVLQWLG